MGSQAPLGKGDLFKTPGAELPGYIREIARALMRNGKSKSQAIQIAIGTVKRWAAGGGDVNPDTRAKAQKALAQWEAAKAKAHATPNKSDHANPVYAPGQRVVFLANAPQDGPAAKKKDDRKGKAGPGSRGADKSKLPPGATGWKHGWQPVDSSGKPVGPPLKPKWLKDAEAKHKAAGGRTADEIRAEQAQNERERKQRKAEEPARKAKAAREKAEREREQAANKRKREAEKRTREAERKRKDAERATEAKAKERERQIKAAYKQAIADRRAGRELSEQQRRVVAYVEAQQRKEQGKLRRVDVPGADGSSVAARKAPATKGKTAPAKGGKLPTPDSKGRKTALPGAVRTAARKKGPAKVKARSYRRSGSSSVTLANPAEGVNAVQVLELAGKFPAGQLAFRYKHGWILINPAIPSRGAMGGALARRHGVKSGSVTHGHFEPKAGGGKKFVPDRTGGPNDPKALKAAHAKDTADKGNQSKYRLAAAEKDTGTPLAPSTPSAAAVKAASDRAMQASKEAQQDKTLKSAQVAAKKHADAFVKAKKAGDTPTADKHKTLAQDWAKKAAQIKKAEAASKAAKAKYEAEQMAKAKAEQEAAEKAQAEALAAKKAAMKKSALEVQDAYQLNSMAVKMPSNNEPALKAKAQQYQYAADKYAQAEKTMKAAGLPVSDELKKAKKAAQFNADEFNKQAGEYKDKANHANELGTSAYDTGDAAMEKKSLTLHQVAAKKHADAAKLFEELGQTGNAEMHKQMVAEHEKLAQQIKAEKQAALKAPSAPPAKPEKKSSANAIDEVIAGLPEEVGGSQAMWDDYLHASYKVKTSSGAASPEDMQALVKATKALQADGADLDDIKAATSQLFKKIGVAKPAKKTAAQKAAEVKPGTDATKKAYIEAYNDLVKDGMLEQAAKVKAGAIAKGFATDADFPAPKAEKQYTAEDFKVTLPGPGMYADGNAVTKAFKAVDAETDPAKKAAKLAAAENAVKAFEAKHGKEFDTSKVELMSSPNTTFTPQTGSHSADHPFWDSAKAEGFQPVPTHVSANGDWKPSHVPGLKSSKGAYTYSGGSYSEINSHLRSGGDPKGGYYADSVAQMDKEFAAVPPLTEGIVTIRKMSDKGPFNDAPPYMEPGGVFEDKGYSSTSKNPGVWSGSVTMQVRIPAGSKVLDLNHTTGSQHSGEQEILLNRGSKYKIVSDGPGHDGSGRLIVVELVP